MDRHARIQIHSGKRAPLAVAAALASLGVSVACCQQVLSIDGPVLVDSGADVNVDSAPDASADADAEAAVPVACGLPIGSDSCRACVATSCCDEATTCAGDPPCRALESCLLGCGNDYACRATCTQANVVAAQKDAPTLDTCVAVHCSDACGAICGMAGSYVEPDAAQGCQECIQGKACQASQACATDLDCELTGHCAYACTTPDCATQCYADSPDASTFFDAALSVGLPCYFPCRVGHYWRCVGNVSWPFARSTTQEATLTLSDPDPLHNNGRYAGATVKACGSGDLACAQVLGSATSDATGVVTVPLPGLAPVAFGFQGYFDVSTPGGASPPILYFFPYPLSEPDAQLTLLVPTTLDFQQGMDLVHVTPDPARGHISLVAQDCLFIAAGQVTVSAEGMDTEATQVYVSGGQPSLTATQTDISGTVDFYNVAPGQYTLHVSPANLQGHYSSTVRVLVRAGALTVVTAIPTPL